MVRPAVQAAKAGRPERVQRRATIAAKPKESRQASAANVMTFNLPKGGIVGIIGPNGAGKTTLFKMIVGTEQPTSGKLTVGATVKPAHVDQNRDALVATNTIFEEITGGTDYIMRHSEI